MLGDQRRPPKHYEHALLINRAHAKARRRLAPYAPAHGGVDVEHVLAQVDAAAEAVAAGRLDLLDPEV